AEVALGLAAGLRGQVLPEQAVQHVAGDVEGELVLERRDALEIALSAHLDQLLDAVVGRFHVGAVVLVVVELHDLPGEVRLQGAVVVRKIGKDVAGHVGALLSGREAPRSAWIRRDAGTFKNGRAGAWSWSCSWDCPGRERAATSRAGTQTRPPT